MNVWLCEPDLALELSRAVSALGGSVHHRVKEEEVVVHTAGAWELFRGSFSFLRPQARTETVWERKQDAGSQEGCPHGQGHGLLYRFFFVSFFGLLLAEGTAALGFFRTSAPLASDCSASVSWDLEMGTMMAKTQMSWKMAPRKSPYRSRFSRKVGSGTSGGEKSRSEAMTQVTAARGLLRVTLLQNQILQDRRSAAPEVFPHDPEAALPKHQQVPLCWTYRDYDF